MVENSIFFVRCANYNKMWQQWKGKLNDAIYTNYSILQFIWFEKKKKKHKK